MIINDILKIVSESPVIILLLLGVVLYYTNPKFKEFVDKLILKINNLINKKDETN